MTHDEIISVLKSINGNDLHDENGMLSDILSELSKAGLYFVTYKDLENVVIVSSNVDVLQFDLDRNLNYDILVKKNGDDLKFELDMEHDPNPDRDDVSYYASKSHLNLIKVVQNYGNVILEPTFDAIEFNILRGEHESPALLFTKDAIK